MSDLVAFLKARLDEDYYLAHRFAFTGQAEWDAEMLARLWWYGPGDAPKSRSASDPIIQHVARHDPARVLREVEAKRAILELHKVYSEPEILNIDHHDKKWNTGWVEHKETGHAVYWCEECDHDRDYGHVASREEGCRTLRHLAAIYSGHPDYREEWKP